MIPRGPVREEIKMSGGIKEITVENSMSVHDVMSCLKSTFGVESVIFSKANKGNYLSINSEQVLGGGDIISIVATGCLYLLDNSHSVVSAGVAVPTSNTLSGADSASTSGVLTSIISGQPTSNSYSLNAGVPTRNISDSVSISGTLTGTISGQSTTNTFSDGSTRSVSDSFSTSGLTGTISGQPTSNSYTLSMQVCQLELFQILSQLVVLSQVFRSTNY